jgi:hypothetical protein
LGKELDSFFLSSNIPRDPKGYPPLPTGEASSHSVKEKIEGVVEKGKTMEFSSPQQPMPQKRGRPRKNREPGEAQDPKKPRAKLVFERLIMCVVWLEPFESSRREICDKQRRSGTESMDVHEPSQQLKQEKLSIVELY